MFELFLPSNFEFSKNIAPLLISTLPTPYLSKLCNKKMHYFLRKSYFCTEIWVESGFRLHKNVLFFCQPSLFHIKAPFKIVYFRLISSFVFSKQYCVKPHFCHLRRGHVKILKRLSLSAELWIIFLWLACLSRLSQ